jgi:hypothetical protein
MVNTGPTYPLPQRTPMDHLARWGMPPPPDQVPHVTDPAAYRSPGDPPWHVPPARALRASMVGWVAVAVTAVLAVCGGLSLIVGPVDSGVPEPGVSDQAGSVGPVDAGPPVHRIGETFRSGQFEYTIHGVKTGIREVGGEYLKERAQGRFTRLDITIKNVDDRSHYFDTDLRIKVEDGDGRRFSSSTPANVTGNPENDGWLTEINPGNSVRLFAFFDLPSEVQATRAVFGAGILSFEDDAVVPLGKAR